MYKFLTKNGQLLAFGLGAFITVISVVLIMSGLSDFNLLDKETRVTSDIFNFGMKAGIALVFICALLMLVFGLMQIASNPKGSIKGIIGLIVMVVVFFVAKSMAAPAVATDMKEAMEKYNVTDGIGSYISGGISLTLLVGAIAVAALFISEIRNFFK